MSMKRIEEKSSDFKWMPSRKRKQETSLEEDELRKELQELKLRMAQMDEVSRKLDQLLQRR